MLIENLVSAAKFVQEHLDCFPEHGIVRCKRLECNITLDNKSCSYAIPQTYRFSGNHLAAMFLSCCMLQPMSQSTDL